MKIVVLDGYTLNPGDLSWDKLAEVGELTVYDRTPPEQVIERVGDAHIVLINKTVLSAQIIAELANLKYIGVLSTGYNVVDLKAARKRNIPVANVPDYATDSVAQAVFAHLLNLTRHTVYHAQTVRDGCWTTCEDFCYWQRPLIELSGMTFGIVGLGRIGRAVAKLAAAFGMKVIAYDVTKGIDEPEAVEVQDLHRIFTESDVVSLHCPLTHETEKLVNKENLALMKNSAFLINTSRGPLVDEQALADALNAGQLAGAGLDVLAVEPPQADNPLLNAKNCYITPHIAWASKAARQRLLNTVVENCKAFLEGNPQNVVNP